MKLVIYIDNSEISGVAVWARGVASSLLALHHETTLLVRSGPATVSPIGREFPCQYLHPNHRRGRLKTFFAAYRYARRSQPSLVHCTSPQIPILLALWLAGVKRTCSIHVFPRRVRGYLAVAIASWICSTTISVSETLTDDLCHRPYISRKRIVTVREGVEPPDRVHLYPLQRRSFGIVSRLTTGKGLDDIGRWWPHIHSATGWSLHVFGSGRMAESLRLSAPKSGLHWHGPVFDHEIIYDSIGILVVASERETFCRPAIEAAIRGIPVLARHDLPVLSELLGNLITYASEPDPASLIRAATAATTTADHPTPQELHDACWPRLTTERQVQDLATLFDRLCRSS